MKKLHKIPLIIIIYFAEKKPYNRPMPTCPMGQKVMMPRLRQAVPAPAADFSDIEGRRYSEYTEIPYNSLYGNCICV